MGLKVRKGIELTVTSFKGELRGGLSVKEFEERLESLDPANPEGLAKDLERCNDRCDDNDVEVQAKITDLSGEQETVHMISFKGRMSK